MSTTYVVKTGESLWDVVINSTGTLANLDTVLSANDFDDWTPELIPGQLITIPDNASIDTNALMQFQQYPVCNNSVNDIDDQIAGVFDLLDGFWILTTSFWNDQAPWLDDKTWND